MSNTDNTIVINDLSDFEEPDELEETTERNDGSPLQMDIKIEDPDSSSTENECRPLQLIPLEKVQDGKAEVRNFKIISEAENVEDILRPEVLNKEEIRTGVKRKASNEGYTFDPVDSNHTELIEYLAWLRVGINYLLSESGFSQVQFHSSAKKTQPLEQIKKILAPKDQGEQSSSTG